VAQQHLSNRRPAGKQFLLVTSGVLLVLVAAIIVFGGYHFGWGWTGIVKDKDFPKRTLWDWLQLFIIPAVLAGGGIWINRQQEARSDEAEDQRAQEAALQAYLDHISDLVRDKDQPLHNSERSDRLSAIARARTLMVLTRLDGDRKARVVEFLYESDLITRGRVIVDLNRANLRGADLRDVNLVGVLLDQPSLMGAAFIEAQLPDDHFEVQLPDDDFEAANLHRTDLREADLRGADLRRVNLREADLRKANLAGAYLMRAFLPGADLRNANLAGALLIEGYLKNAQVSKEQLASCKSLKGATMPDGSKHS
jgi:uncharacterized protein YjbI with pentapeptide repeats